MTQTSIQGPQPVVPKKYQRPMSRPSKMAIAWIARAGGTIEASGGAGTLEAWQTPPHSPGYRRLSKQVIFNLEAKGLIRFTVFKVGRDGKWRPVKGVLVQQAAA